MPGLWETRSRVAGVMFDGRLPGQDRKRGENMARSMKPNTLKYRVDEKHDEPGKKITEGFDPHIL